MDHTWTNNNLDKTVEKIEEWAFERNFIVGSDPKSQTLKAVSELGELCDAILKGDTVGQKDGIGDVVVVLTIVAAQLGFTLNECVAHSYNEIKDRKGVMYHGAYVKSTDARYESILEILEAERKNGV
jgi:NTP pyrophosphatase (non-canonical NTP hydrolase)